MIGDVHGAHETLDGGIWSKNLEAMWSQLFTHDLSESNKAEGPEAGEEKKGLTIFDSHNGFKNIS